jgi:hypothetical protein
VRAGSLVLCPGHRAFWIASDARGTAITATTEQGAAAYVVRKLLARGLVVNLAALEGLRTLNTFPRGIATGHLYADLALMEDYVNTTRSNTREKLFLNVLGIRVVLAFESEEVAAGLDRLGDLVYRLTGILLGHAVSSATLAIALTVMIVTLFRCLPLRVEHRRCRTMGIMLRASRTGDWRRP